MLHKKKKSVKKSDKMHFCAWIGFLHFGEKKQKSMHLASLFVRSKKETSSGASLDLSNRLACSAMASSVWACDGLQRLNRRRKRPESEVNRRRKHCGFVQSWPQLTPRCLHTRTVWTGPRSHKSTKTSSMKQICSCSPFSTRSMV